MTIYQTSTQGAEGSASDEAAPEAGLVRRATTRAEADLVRFAAIRREAEES